MNRRRTIAPRRPRLEDLECRALLSTMFVDDDWAGTVLGTAVGPGQVYGTNAFSTIPAAINGAAPGDDIQIAAGTYAITSTITVGKSVSLVGAGPTETFLDATGATSSYAVSVTAADVSLSGFALTGSTSNGPLRYGIYGSGVDGLSISDVVVASMPRTGVNLIGATNSAISNVISRDNNGAGFFFTDVKGLTLTDVQTSGNAWTGAGFSTSGRYYAGGVEGVVISGSSQFGETESDNGGVMFEEGRWDPGSAMYVLENPIPISFSSDPGAGADVTFLQAPAFNFALTGPQDDSWPVRYRFYETIGQVESAFNGSPDHYDPSGREIVLIGTFTPTLTMSGPTNIAVESPYTLQLSGGDGSGTISSWEIDWGDGQTTTLPEGESVGVHMFAPGTYTIRAWAETAVGLYEVSPSITAEVTNEPPTVSILDAPSGVAQGTTVHLTGQASDPAGVSSYVWTARLGETVVAAGSGTSFDFTPMVPGSYVVSLQAADAYGAVGVATATIAVENVAPVVAIVGAPASVFEGTVIPLSATGSDVDPNLVYAWTASLDGSVVASGTGVAFAFAPATPGMYLVTLVGTDPYGASHQAQATISVLSAAPTVQIVGAPSSVNQGEPVQLTASGSSPIGSVTYAWTVSTGGTVVATGTGATIAFTPTTPGAYSATATVTDERGASAMAMADFAVLNVAPSVTISPIPGSIDAGAAVVLVANATDPNPAVVPTYAWTVRRGSVVVAQGVGPSLTYTPYQSGAYEALVEVSDGEGGSAQATVAFTVVSTLPPAVEQAVEEQIVRVSVQAEQQVQRQDQRLQVIYERFGESPPPIAQRMIARITQTKARIEALAVRRVAAIQRTFLRMARGRR